MPETPLSLIQYFKEQHILKGLGNKLKNNLKHFVGPTFGVEFPPVTGWGVEDSFKFQLPSSYGVGFMML